MSAMRQPFTIAKSGGNTQSTKSSDLSAFRIDPDTMLELHPRQSSSTDQFTSSKPEDSKKLARAIQSAALNTSSSRSSNAVIQTAAQVRKPKLGEPSHPNTSSYKKKAKPLARNAGPYHSEPPANQREETVPNSKPIKETDQDTHEQLSTTHNARKRSRHSLEATKDIQNYRSVTHDTSRQTPDSKELENPMKRHFAPLGFPLQSASQEMDLTVLPDSDAPPSSQPSFEGYFNSVNDNMEDDDVFSNPESRQEPHSSQKEACCLSHVV